MVQYALQLEVLSYGISVFTARSIIPNLFVDIQSRFTQSLFGI